MVENRKFVGFGIVGAPKGRQYSNAGADKEIHFAKYFDLSQIYGGALPSPKTDQLSTTLYYLTYQGITNGQKVLGIAEYYSVGEMGQSRPGSYLGSFVEAINTRFTSAESIFSALDKMNQYQIMNFIDRQEISYNALIDDVDFISPETELDTIANSLQKLRTPSISVTFKDDLYIYLSNDRECIDILNIILEKDLYYIYNNIYFSSSDEIYERLKNKKKGIKIISSSSLLSSTVSFSNELSTLYQQEILQLKQKYQHQLEYQRKILEVEKESEISAIMNDNDRIGRQLQEAEANLRMQAEYFQNNKTLVNFAEDMVKVFSQNKENISLIDLNELPTIQSDRNLYQDLIERFDKVNRNIKELDFHYIMQKPKEVRKESIFTWMFFVLSLIFAIVIGVQRFTGNNMPMNNGENLNKLTNELATKLDNIENKLVEQDNRIKEISNSLIKKRPIPSNKKK
ncbi:hypothetical protein L4F92_02315 [Avibacterium sp. 21-595]|uniref:hypothetical protein n=1 Tax=Avibacterium sp. 21-595 TaxID=2911527 RepID=UPI002026571E|nr:hypothetical protein [Avibacterium sp. 21-595]URL06968.1 hypothetical protein L4F92_02315 [Avibacterium sp. 21-595]